MGKLDAELFKKLSQRLVDLDQMSLSTVLSTLSYAKTVISDRLPRLERFSGSTQWYTELRANIENDGEEVHQRVQAGRPEGVAAVDGANVGDRPAPCEQGNKQGRARWVRLLVDAVTTSSQHACK